MYQITEFSDTLIYDQRTKGGYWTGSLYQIDKQVYTALFGKISIYDLHDIDIHVLA
jgi:hypothetical protein